MSGRKNAITAHLLTDNQSLATDFQSEIVNISYLDNVGVQIVTSSITDNLGEFSIQASINGVNWETLTLSPVIPSLADADTTILANLNQLPFKQFRVSFEAAGTTPDGTCSIWISAKEI